MGDVRDDEQSRNYEKGSGGVRPSGRRSQCGRRISYEHVALLERRGERCSTIIASTSFQYIFNSWWIYRVPKGSRVFVNAWAIHRDPEAWIDPLRFQPERFLRTDDDPLKKYDYRGNNFDFIPFGSGRRVCVGINLAERMLTYVPASLLQSIDLKLPEGTKLDIAETFGVVLSKSTPLAAIRTSRLSNLQLYEESMSS